MKVLTVRPDEMHMCEPSPKIKVKDHRKLERASEEDIAGLFDNTLSTPRSKEIEQLEKQIAATYATKAELPPVSFSVEFQWNVPCLIVTAGDRKYRFIGSEV